MPGMKSIDFQMRSVVSKRRGAIEVVVLDEEGGRQLFLWPTQEILRRVRNYTGSQRSA